MNINENYAADSAHLINEIYVVKYLHREITG